MSFSTAHFARRFRLLSWLRVSLVLGALYDFAFAAAMWLAPELPARLLDLPLAPRFYLWVMATLLSMLALLYLVAARDTRRYSAIVAVAIAGRLAGGMLMLAIALGSGLSGLYPLAVADLGLGLAHALFWFPLRS